MDCWKTIMTYESWEYKNITYCYACWLAITEEGREKKDERLHTRKY